MKVYLAGPMRGYDHYNYPLFEAATNALRDAGHDVVSPHEIDMEEGYVDFERDENGAFTRVELTELFTMEKALARDFREIIGADAIVLLPGWHDSQGAMKERQVAIDTGTEVFQLTVKQGPHGDPYPVLVPVPNDWYPPLRDVSRDFESDGQVHTSETPPAGEIRVVDPETGGAKGSKLARFDLLPYDALWSVAEHFGRGAAKYEERNWERGYRWSLSAAAMQRHFAAWWQGEDIDEETGDNHAQAFAWHGLVLLAFVLRGAGTDDRPGTVRGYHAAE